MTFKHKQLITKRDFSTAIEVSNNCLKYSHNLGEGKLHGVQETNFHFWLGFVYEGPVEIKKANKYWEFDNDGNTGPAAAIFSNYQKPDKIFYQGLALFRLGQKDEANLRFNNLIAFGNEHLDENI